MGFWCHFYFLKFMLGMESYFSPSSKISKFAFFVSLRIREIVLLLLFRFFLFLFFVLPAFIIHSLDLSTIIFEKELVIKREDGILHTSFLFFFLISYGSRISYDFCDMIKCSYS